MTLRLLFLPIAILAALAGCGAREPVPPPSPPLPTIRVAAASDLQAAFPILRARFRLDRGIDVEPTFGASGVLSRQILQGAPFDVFLAANRAFVDDLVKEKAIDAESRRDYAVGTLVLAVNSASKVEIKDLDDLAKPEVKKVAIANPDLAPYGAAARQALKKAGLLGRLDAKIVQGETVRQALQFVETGNAEAGLVGRAIADVKGVRSIEVDPALYDPIVQALGVVSASKRKADARAFAEFVLGPVGRGILGDFGLAPPPSSGPSAP